MNKVGIEETETVVFISVRFDNGQMLTIGIPKTENTKKLVKEDLAIIVS